METKIYPVCYEALTLYSTAYILQYSTMIFEKNEFTTKSFLADIKGGLIFEGHSCYHETMMVSRR